MAFVALAENEAAPEEAGKAEDRQFRGSFVQDLETVVEAGSNGADGVCG